MNSKIVFQFLFFLLSFYCFGAAMMDSFVVYHSWKFVGAAEFAQVHQQSSIRIVQVFVSATFLMTITTVILLWKRPANIPRQWIWIALACEIVSWVSSAVIQIPIQGQLSQGRNEDALNRLIMTDWIRIAAWVFYIVVASRMLVRVLIENNESART
jgi:hypothetical protein